MSKKIGISRIYYSILTSTPLQGRPCLFIEIADEAYTKTKKMSLKKIEKVIDKKCASHLIAVVGQNLSVPTMYGELGAMIVRKGFNGIFFTNGKEDTVASKFPFAPKQLFICVNVVEGLTKKSIDVDTNKYMDMCLYRISSITKAGKDGLPRGLYRPDNIMKVMITPSNNRNEEAVKATTDLCLQFGYYMTYKYTDHIGVE